AEPDQRHQRLPPGAHHDSAILGPVAKGNIKLAQPKRPDARLSGGHAARRVDALRGGYAPSLGAVFGRNREPGAILDEVRASERRASLVTQHIAADLGRL